MATITIDFQKHIGPVKPMHAVNNGPIIPPRIFSKRGNFDDYKNAGIPFARNHDASFLSSYGGDRTVDINNIFRDFEKDPYDPASYDFTCTDHYTKSIMDAGTEVFYRLGNKIDHRIKKYDSVPPADFKKWAVICEHIIAHYNEGWADGFYLNIKYWEIWNEPDNVPECWDGTFEDFLELYRIAATHLKNRFPTLKFGGPAFTTGGINKRAEEFLRYLREHNVPLDFFSWHTYRSETDEYKKRILKIRQLLDDYGFNETESILNEWNYVINWKDGMNDSIKTIISLKGAAFTAAVMLVGQNTPVDMLMYYDARPCTLNGLFDFYTFEKLKGYYPFPMFSKLYRLGTQVQAESDRDNIYVAAASDGEKNAVMISYFTNDTEAEPEIIKLDASGEPFTVSLLDDTHDAECVGIVNSNGEITMAPNTVILLEQ